MLFFAIFRLLAEPDLPRRSLWSGSLLGAVGFEVLKQISTLLLSATKDQPAFQAFGIALILVVWINYFSRLVLYSAAWAYTTAQARALRDDLADAVVQGPATPALDLAAVGAGGVPASSAPAGSSARSRAVTFAAGAAAAAGLAALLRKKD